MMAAFEREAQETLDVFAGMFEKRGWKYNRSDEHGCIYTGIVGDDLPMNIMIRADAGAGVLQIVSKIPVDMAPEKIVEAAIIVNEFNDGRLLGNFDMDVTRGLIIFKTCTCIADSRVSEEACSLLFDYTVRMIDNYNDKFLMLNKGMLTMEKILADMEQ